MSCEKTSGPAGAAFDRFTLIDTGTEKKIAEQERLDGLQEVIEKIVGL